MLERPERAVGMHFFNPAPLMPLVEIVRAERTAEDVFEAAFAFGATLGKTPIRCNDTPGFVVNRILIPLLNDCVRVLDEAGVTPEDLDAAMKHGAGWPMGPCALLDLVGADVHVHASEALYEKLREPRMAPPPRLVRMLQARQARPQDGRGLLHATSSRPARAPSRRAAMAMCQRLPPHAARGRALPHVARARRDQTVCAVREPARRGAGCGARRRRARAACASRG